MGKIKTIAFVTGIATLFAACNNNKTSFDASGSFEAEERIISSEATGTIKQFELEEGQMLQSGQTVGYIDSTQLYLKKKQLLAQTKATASRAVTHLSRRSTPTGQSSAPRSASSMPMTKNGNW